MNRGLAAPLALALAAAAGCGEDDGTRPNYEYMPDMVSSPAYDSFAPNPVTRDGRTLMAPPRGTVPRGYEPLHFGPGPAEAARAGRELTAPIPGGPLVRERGEIAFHRWCSPCHGAEGQGDGLVARKFPRPPSLTADHARALPDGQIFHVISFGQGVMPSYSQQITPRDRWILQRHVRELQTRATVAAAPAGPPAPPAGGTP